MKTQDLYAAARKLSPEERVQFVQDLWDSLAAEPVAPPTAVDAALEAELLARLDRFRSGGPGYTIDQAKALLKRRRARRRHAP
jgi:putative addiction module component (TIGR02574 family)